MRVLIVDDQAASSDLLSQMVTAFGHQTLVASGGKQAITAMPQFRPDIILLDVLMPGLSGLQTAPKLKEMAGDTHLPIIFITALDEQQTLLECLQAGGDDFLSKPFDPVLLEAKLKVHCKARQLSLSLADKNKALAYHSARVEREHLIVEHILHNSLASNHLDYPHVHTYLSSTSMFNGDVFLVAPGPLGNMYFMLGDFTGHGLSAAIGALPTSQTFFAMTARGASVGEIVRSINSQLHRLLPTDMFLAALVIELSASGERMTYWNGGIPPVLHMDKTDTVHQVMQPQHLALGILSEHSFDSRVSSLRVSQDDSLLLYTDGLIELVTTDGMLGVDGLCGLLDKCKTMDHLMRKVRPLAAAEPQRDDLSIVWLQCKPTGLQPHADNTPLSPLSFDLITRLGADDIRNDDPVQRLMRNLARVQGFSSFKTELFTVLQEAYKNAVEHGLLRLDSALKQHSEGFERYYQLYHERLAALDDGWIELSISYQAGARKIIIRVSDSGPGFCVSATPQTDAEQAHGRGLHLMRQLSSAMRWYDNGRTIELVLPLYRQDSV